MGLTLNETEKLKTQALNVRLLQIKKKYLLLSDNNGRKPQTLEIKL
jgi:hypothetical protein